MARPDRANLCAWFAAHGRGLVLFARQALPAEHRASAEDVVQELFVRLLARTAEHDADAEAEGGVAAGGLDPAHPAAWLYRCVRNACEDERRSRVRRSRRERAVAAGRPDWFEPSPGDRVDARQAQAALAALDDLPRQVVVLRVWSGLTLAETADVVGLPLSTVYDHYRKALAALRAAMRRPESAATARGQNAEKPVAWSLQRPCSVAPGRDG